MTKPEIVVQTAEEHMGCPYVYGTWGQTCTPELRRRYAEYSPSQKAITYRRCPVLSDKQTTCIGCKYMGMLAFDCRGFTHYCIKQAGIDISGGYVRRQWSDPNWDVKGNVSDMLEAVACVFTGDYSHTGLYTLGGRVIHCSVEVKADTLTGGRDWQTFAIPKGLYTWQELVKLVKGEFSRMLRKGSQGADVRDMQIMLNSLGFDCGTADGIFGVKTETAVKQFQEFCGLVVDGIAGTNTLQLLKQKALEQETPDEPEVPDEPDDPETITLPLEDLILIRDYARKIQALVEKALE